MSNIKNIESGYFKHASWALFFIIVLFYCAMYAPFGLENNDGGFTMGMAHQFFLGERFYDHIIMVRPPVSPMLHSFVFYPPFAQAPLLSDRIFFFVQIALYSSLSALLAKKFFSWSSLFTAITASVSFVFSAHSFPPMGWHTVDGILFSVISIYFLVVFLERSGTVFSINNNNKTSDNRIKKRIPDSYGKYVFLLISAGFALIAAGAKQPYYLVPVIALSISLVAGGLRGFTSMLLALICSGAVLLACVSPYVDSDLIFKSISSQTNLRDLFNAGFLDYIKDVKRSKSVIFVWPMLIGLGLISFKDHGNRKITVGSFIVAIYLFLGAIGYFYFSAKKFTIPSAYIDTVFVGTLLISFLMLKLQRNCVWIVIVAMHMIGWAASISWGYQTTILFAAPSVIVIAFALHWATVFYPRVKIASIAILPLSMFIFYMANQFYFSSEGPVSRSSITADMGEISPAFTFIKSTPKQFALYSELNAFIGSIDRNPFVVLPNIPLAHTMVGQTNPIGIDWAMNAEIGNSMDKVKDRLNTSVEYAIVYKKASPSPDLAGKFGSDITNYVKANWFLANESENFYFFRKP